MGRLPKELSDGLRGVGLADPGILEGYPRDDFGELVAAGVTGLGTTGINDGGVTLAGADVDTGMAVVRPLVTWYTLTM